MTGGHANINPSPGPREDNQPTGNELPLSGNLPFDVLDFGNYPELEDDNEPAAHGAPLDTISTRPNANPPPLAVSHPPHRSTTREQLQESYSIQPLDIEVDDSIQTLLGITQENRSLVETLTRVSTFAFAYCIRL
jgi:hypothetical protein